MNFKGHFIGGLGVAVLTGGGLTVNEYSLTVAGITAAAVFTGSQFPDFDTGSIPARWFGRIGFFFNFAVLLYSLKMGNGLNQWMIAATVVGLISLFSQGSKHRGLTHKYYIPLILAGLFFYPEFKGTLLPFICAGLSAGIFTHLFIDCIFPWKIKAWI